MQAWHRQVLMIAALFLLPPLSVFGIGIGVAAVMANGALAAMQVLLPGFGIVMLSALVSPEGGAVVAAFTAGSCLVALVLGELARRTRSLTLTIQLTVLLALVVVGGVYVLVSDASELWRGSVEEALAAFVEAGRLVLTEEQTLEAWAEAASGVATGMFVVSLWFIGSIALLTGYYLWDHGCDESRARLGRFRELNLGRVLAALLVVLALLAATGGEVWLNLALVLLLAFGLHGLALAHWARFRYRLPLAALLAVYFVVIGVNYAAIVVCVAGYVDAWFNFVRGNGQTPPAAA